MASTAGPGAGTAGTDSRARTKAHPAWHIRAGTAWWPLAAVALVALVALVASFFRLWHLASLPPGLFGDEAADGLDALDVLAGRGAVFFPANFGREGLHIWLVAGMFRWLGVSSLALRLPSVIAGILTALVTYWLGVELARSVQDVRVKQAKAIFGLSAATFVGLTAALYLSTSYFHVHFSRFGIRGIFTPLCGAVAFAAFWRGMNAGRRYSWYALSGLFLGLSLHFYTASRFYPIFLAGFLILQAIVALARRRPKEIILVRDIGPLVVLFLAVILAFAPLGLYFLQHPGSFSQRAAEVTAFRGASPWVQIGHAAWANTLQFFVPGAGDTAQFYNLPGRAIFDMLTAFLALVGIAVLFFLIRQPAALFLLLWWPAMMLPSFLATDRFPTLPRVLGTLPGIYFYPAIGLLAVLVGLRTRLTALDADPGKRKLRHAVLAGMAALAVLALLVPAGLTYRDYFLRWGGAPETADAFELDMTQAAGWLAANRPGTRVYLSSDIYRHPTLMLLYEHATVNEYFKLVDPNLSWFDGRSALPLPPAGQAATYVIGNSARPPEAGAGTPLQQAMGMLSARAGEQPAALTVMDLPAGPGLPASGTLEKFTEGLGLLNAAWSRDDGADPLLWLYWHTDGPDPAEWPGYRLQVVGMNPDGSGWEREVPFDDFRPPEWVAGGRFLTWRRVPVPGRPRQLPAELRLRLIKADSLEPVTGPGAPDGWHVVPAANGS